MLLLAGEPNTGKGWLSGLGKSMNRNIVFPDRGKYVSHFAETGAKTRKGIVPKQIIFHCDQSIQYTSEEFCQKLKRFGITQSMSGKSDCWGNTPCESFWGKLKREWLNHYGPSKVLSRFASRF